MSSESAPLMSKEEIIKNFQDVKTKIALLTKESKFTEAIQGYNDFIKDINKTLNENKEISKEDKNFIIKEFLISSYSNLCFINIKLNDWNSVIKNSSLILRYDKENAKALYRKCFAEINIYEYERAEYTLNALKKIMPDNSEISRLEKMLDEKRTEDNLKKMKKYKNMMRCYHKLNEEKEYQEMSKIGRFFYNCKGVCKRIFCCCNKRRTVKRMD